MRRIWFVGQVALHRFSFLDGQHLAQIEDRLFPMRVFRVWTCGEADRLVARCEVDVEPRDQRVDKIIALAAKLEGS